MYGHDLLLQSLTQKKHDYCVGIIGPNLADGGFQDFGKGCLSHPYNSLRINDPTTAARFQREGSVLDLKLKWA